MNKKIKYNIYFLLSYKNRKMSDTESISEFSMSQSTQITRYSNDTETCNPNILRQLKDLPVQTMVNIFSNEKKYINEDEEIENKLYYVRETTKETNEETIKIYLIQL